MTKLENNTKLNSSNIKELLLIRNTLTSILLVDEAELQPPRTQDSFSVQMDQLKKQALLAQTPSSRNSKCPLLTEEIYHRLAETHNQEKIRKAWKRIEEFQKESNIKRHEILTEMIQHEALRQ